LSFKLFTEKTPKSLYVDFMTSLEKCFVNILYIDKINSRYQRKKRNIRASKYSFFNFTQFLWRFFAEAEKLVFLCFV